MSDSAAPSAPWSGYSEALGDTAELVPLASRRVFERDLIRGAADRPRTLALIALDIDHFKKVNDTYGHGVGDRILVRVATTLREIVGRRGRAYRCGGEEFMALLPGFTEGEAAAVAERIRRSVEALTFGHGEPERITASLGVAELSADETIDAFVKRADGALYLAKNRGRNQVAAANGDYGQRPETRPSPFVLVVNESRRTRDALVELLVDEGFDAAGPLEGHEALNLTARNPVAAFVSLEFDEGWVAIEHFVQAIKGRNPNARVYGMTTYGPEKVAPAMACGADGVLQIPFSFRDLLALAIAARDGLPPPLIR